MKHLLVAVFAAGFAALLLQSDTAAQNYKIKQSSSMNGQESSSTVYVKGSRKRTEGSGIMGIGADVATIEQCDLKRNLLVNDKKKLYFIEPFAIDDNTDSTSARPAVAPSTGKVTKGGTVTMTTSIIDTGERKQMYGLTARHVKTSMTMQSSPDACMKNDMSVETDGWYVDLPQFSCPMAMPRNPMAAGGRAPRSGCQDRMIVRSSGGGKLGFAVQLTTTMKGGGGEGMSLDQQLQTLEFSKATLDDSLFDIPAGYSLANSSQDLYGKPDFSAMMRGMENDGNASTGKPRDQSRDTGVQPKRSGVIRIGVLAPTNRSGENISITNMQGFLAEKLTAGNAEGVAVGSEADARAAGCDYLLTSDFSKLKQSNASKIGGIFGKITNTDTSAAKNYDAQVDFTLVKLADHSNTLQNKAANKTEGNVDRAAETVLALEAAAILRSLGQ